MLTIRDPSLSPPETRWTFYVPATGFKVSVPAYVNLANAIALHCRTNGVDAPSEQEVVKYVCDNHTVDCREDGRPYHNLYTAKEDFVHPEYRPVPHDQWPVWVRGIALFSTNADKGIGDTIARTIGPFGGDLFKKWHKQVFNQECDCSKRQDKWNAQFPLNNS